MAEILTLSGYSPANLVEKTGLSVDVAAALTTVTAKDVTNIAANDFVIIGTPGEDDAEKRKVTAVNTTTQVLTLVSALTFAHKRFESVTKLRGDQIRLYRASNVDGTVPASFSLLATIDIPADQLSVQYTDSTGGSSYWYRQTYYNSVSLAETNLTDAPAKRGGDFGHFCTVDEVRAEAGLSNNPDYPDWMIADRRDDAESEIKGTLRSAGYTLPFATIPSTVRNVTKLLAAGYLLQQDYGPGVEGSTKEGQGKINMAYQLLEKIMNHQIVLLDAVEADVAERSSINGWPDETTAGMTDTGSHGGDFAVTSLMRF